MRDTCDTGGQESEKEPALDDDDGSDDDDDDRGSGNAGVLDFSSAVEK